MRKILYGVMIFVLATASVIVWHRCCFYAVGFFMPIDRGPQTANIETFRGLQESWQLGISDANASDKYQLSTFEIPADIDQSIPVLKQRIAQFLDEHARWWWDDKKLLIVAGFSTGQLKTAHETVQAANRSIVCVSPLSTTAQATAWQNVLQMVHNDEFAAQAIAMFVRRKKYDKVAVLYIPNDSYSHEYNNGVTKAIAKQEIPLKSFAFDANSIVAVVEKEVNAYVRDAKKPALIFTGFPKEIIRAEKILDAKMAIICSDSCNNLGDVFAPTREATVVVPAIGDYTPVTRSVYRRIFQTLEKRDQSFDFTLSPGTPFMYDFAHQLGGLIAHNFELTWRFFAIKINAATPDAALSSTWYTAQQNGPAHGGYWFIYTHDPKTTNLVEYRKNVLGNVITLPQSAAVAYQIGHYAWAGLSGWNMYQNLWENYYLHGAPLVTKLSYSNYQLPNGTTNWTPFHVKKYRENNGKWWFASDIPDSYPLKEQRYDLE